MQTSIYMPTMTYDSSIVQVKSMSRQYGSLVYLITKLFLTKYAPMKFMKGMQLAGD